MHIAQMMFGHSAFVFLYMPRNMDSVKPQLTFNEGRNYIRGHDKYKKDEKTDWGNTSPDTYYGINHIMGFLKPGYVLEVGMSSLHRSFV